MNRIISICLFACLPYTIGLFLWAKTGHAVTMPLLAIPIAGVLFALAEIAETNGKGN